MRNNIVWISKSLTTTTATTTTAAARKLRIAAVARGYSHSHAPKSPTMSVANATYDAGEAAAAPTAFAEGNISRRFGPEVINYFSGARIQS